MFSLNRKFRQILTFDIQNWQILTLKIQNFDLINTKWQILALKPKFAQI